MGKKKKLFSSHNYVILGGSPQTILSGIKKAIRKLGISPDTLTTTTINGFTEEKYYVKTKEDADKLVKALQEIANIPKYIPVDETAIVTGNGCLSKFVEGCMPHKKITESFYEVRAQYYNLDKFFNMESILDENGNNISFVSSISNHEVSINLPDVDEVRSLMQSDSENPELTNNESGIDGITQDEIKHVSSACEGMYMDND